MTRSLSCMIWGKDSRKQNRSAGIEAPAWCSDMCLGCVCECECVYLCEGPKTLKAAGHSCSEATLPPQGCEQQAVLGRVGLVGPVGPAELLNGLVGRPGQL